jgi:hypothetical protein
LDLGGCGGACGILNLGHADLTLSQAQGGEPVESFDVWDVGFYQFKGSI